MNVRRIVAVASKEWRETVRDRLFLALAFLVPVLWMLVLGFGLNLDVEQIPFVVVDYDRSALSREYTYRFVESRYFNFQGSLHNEREVERLLASNKIRAAIVIPDKFEERLLAGRSIEVQTLIDGTFPSRSQITRGYVIAINAAFSLERLTLYLSQKQGITQERARQLLQPIKLEVRYLYNQVVKSIWSVAPALLMFELMVAPPLLTALAVVREKESGSIYNIYSSTVSRAEFLIGKLLPYVGISAINTINLWLLATYLFGAPFKGNFAFFFLVSLVFVLCSTGIGLIVSLLVETQVAALIITIIVTIVPTVLYAGLLVPVSSLTHGTQFLAHLLPGMYYTDIVQGSFLKGVGIEVLWPQVVMLVLYATGLLSVGYVLFRKRPSA